jgi:hypothetical protein
MVCVDLCGGDGLATDKHEASPLIMYKHCEWLAQRGKRATLDVFEEQSHTFEQLSKNCSFFHPGIATLTHGDARQYVLPVLAEDQPAFIHCDPNTVDQTPLTKPFVKSFNKYTTYLVTLGCNVSGLKMLPLEKRKCWFEYVRMLIDVLPKHHDAVLFWLNRDSAQWAYLLSIPKVWSREFTQQAIIATSKQWEKGVSAASYRSQRPEFIYNVKRLFLTESELKDGIR